MKFVLVNPIKGYRQRTGKVTSLKIVSDLSLLIYAFLGYILIIIDLNEYSSFLLFGHLALTNLDIWKFSRFILQFIRFGVMVFGELPKVYCMEQIISI